MTRSWFRSTLLASKEDRKLAETVTTLDRALVLLGVLADRGPATVPALAERLGTSRSVALRMVTTLEQHGYVRRSDPGGEVTLGAALVAHAAKVEPALRDAARPVMERLVEQLGETAVLAVRDGTSAVVLEQVVATATPLRVEYGPGFRHVLTRGAPGHALLAYVDPEVVERALADEEDAGILRDRIRATRSWGYAVSHDELEYGANGVAAPVRDVRERVVASLGIVVPQPRFRGGLHLGPEVVAAAAELTAALRVPAPSSRATP